MSVFTIISDLITALKDTGLPVYHQFDEKILAKRNDCFITVGLSELKTDCAASKNDCEISALVSLFVPADYSGGKILSLSSDIVPLITASELDVVGVKASALSYDRQLDRLRYDFTARLSATMSDGDFTAEKERVTVSLGSGLSMTLEEFTLSRERLIPEIQSVSEGVILGDTGNCPIKMTLKGTLFVTAATICRADEILFDGETVNLSFLGTDFPPMRLYDYSIKSAGRLAAAEMKLVAESAEGEPAADE